ncbi:MAG TPA: BamA/TamA family outer membrane protein [Gemmatimonadales bacterium]|nr:BamA/TamA family outer membrane protein [Gemmatimonadales bacterium]
MIIATVVAVVLAAQGPPDSTAYLDPVARRLVARARARRETIDRSITAYRVTMKERIGAGIRALRRDRMLFRRELALRIAWERDGIGRIEVLGARQVVPVVRADAELPEDLKGDVLDYAFDPADDRLTVGAGASENPDTSRNRQGVRVGHPLAPGSEADYEFAAGDSSILTFPDGRTIRLRELRVAPRRVEFRLMAGSLWIDEGSGAVVRALFRPARAFDLEQDEGDDDVPGFLKPIRLEVRFITIDYGLWNGRWWLPRMIGFEGVATAGSWAQMPMRYERLYEDYEVTGDTTAVRSPRPPRRVAPRDSASRLARAREDSAAAAHCRAQGDVECRCRNGSCRAFSVRISPDTAQLTSSAALPPGFAGMGDTLITSGEMQQLSRALALLPEAPWQFRAKPPRWGLARYNRVEGLALGAHAGLDLGRLSVDGAARMALSDGEPDVEAGLVRETGRARLRVAGYRRLAAVDPATRALGIGNSLFALLLGRDDGDYYRAAGIELTIAPAVTRAQSFAVRISAERQRRAVQRTDFSVAHTFDRAQVFRPNIVADSADQLGAAVTFRAQRGFDPEAARWSTEVTLDGGAGTYGFGRIAGALRLTAPLTPRLAGAVELAGGASAGRVPIQSRWFLGGPNTLRGYGGDVASGDAFWRTRIEVANRLPMARVALFTDVGRAAPRDRLSLARPLVGVGIGASFVDGLVRVDLARALRSPKGWRLDFYTDGVL